MIFFPENKKINLYDPERDLSELANQFETDKGTSNITDLSWGEIVFKTEDTGKYLDTWGYTEVYKKYMDKERENKIKLLEVGVCDWRCPFASSKMWASYFKNADLYAIDNFWGREICDFEEEIKYINNIGVNFIYSDQGSEEDWNRIEEGIGKESLDFIIEDGSHYPEHMMYTLYRSSKILKPGGIYFMEDIQNPKTSKGFWGYDNSNILINLLLFKSFSNMPGEYIPQEFADEICSNFTLIDLYLDKNSLNYLAVLQKN